MRRIIVGTAGHVDHGKTTLVKAITGINTDRWEEEQRRGLTIDLGFAPFALPSGKKAAIIDVPGHERFIKNMLAGVSSIDVVILVVAADEGVMPQTEEHLDIIDILQVRHGVVAVTKTDLVDAELLELVEEEIRQRLAGTTLANAPLVPVSALTGQGVTELLTTVEEVIAEAEKTETPKLLRLPIDRVFQIAGHGTVVTGTLIGGEIKLRDEVEILPAGINARVRQIQVHDESVPAVGAGHRVALNLSGVEKTELHRGNVVLEPGVMSPTTLIDARVTVLAKGKELGHRERVRIHIGTNEVLARLRTLEGDTIEPGESGYCQVVFEEPVVAAREDLFVIRSYSPSHTVAGGKVLNGTPLRWKRKDPQTLDILAREALGDPEDLLRLVFELRPGTPYNREDLRRQTLFDQGQIRTELRALLKQGQIVDLDNNQLFLSALGAESLWQKTAELLDDFHDRFPLRKGYPKEELRSRLVPTWESRVFNNLLELWGQEAKLDLYEKEISLPGKGLELSPEETQLAQKVEEEFRQAGFAPPSLSEVSQKYSLTDKRRDEIINYLILQGALVRITENLFFHQENITKAKEVAKSLIEEAGTLDAATFRDATNSSRKYAIALLEYFDSIKWTKRIEEKRIAGSAMRMEAK